MLLQATCWRQHVAWCKRGLNAALASVIATACCNLQCRWQADIINDIHQTASCTRGICTRSGRKYVDIWYPQQLADGCNNYTEIAGLPGVLADAQWMSGDDAAIMLMIVANDEGEVTRDFRRMVHNAKLQFQQQYLYVLFQLGLIMKNHHQYVDSN